MTVGLRQGCVMSPWLFSLYMDGVVREWKARIMNAGVCFNERDGRKCRVSSLLFADDAVLIADSEERLKLALWGSRDELWDWNLVSGKIHRSNTWGLINFPKRETDETLHCFNYRYYCNMLPG